MNNSENNRIQLNTISTVDSRTDFDTLVRSGRSGFWSPALIGLINGASSIHVASTKDYSVEDQRSAALLRGLEIALAKGYFYGRDILALNSGDSATLVKIVHDVEDRVERGTGNSTGTIIAVDSQSRNVEAARINFQKDPLMRNRIEEDAIKLYEFDPLSYLERYFQEHNNQQFNGVALIQDLTDMNLLRRLSDISTQNTAAIVSMPGKTSRQLFANSGWNIQDVLSSKRTSTVYGLQKNFDGKQKHLVV